MTDPELFGIFCREYRDGMPVMVDRSGPPPSERKLFEFYLRSNCVTDPAEVERLWQDRQAKMKRKAAEGNRGPRNGR